MEVVDFELTQNALDWSKLTNEEKAWRNSVVEDFKAQQKDIQELRKVFLIVSILNLLSVLAMLYRVLK